MDKDQLLELTADIVAAHVGNNNVSVNDVANLVAQVHGALAKLDAPDEAPSQGKTPVVSIKASVKPDHLVCMECGKKQKTLKRHLQSAHSMTPAQYRADYGLPASYPMVAAQYSEHRRGLAQAIGLGRNKPAGEATPAKRRVRKPKAKVDA